jgi:hypothetical protein
MKKTYDVMMTETVWYRTTVEAKSKKQAKKKALREHEDGVDYEYDNGPTVVEDVTELVDPSRSRLDVAHERHL